MSPRHSLLSQLALQIVLVGLAPLLLVTLMALVLVRPEITQTVTAQQHSLVAAINHQVQAHLASAARELTMLGRLLESVPGDSPQRQLQYLDLHTGPQSLFEATYLLNEESTVIAAGLPEARRPLRHNLLGLDLSRHDFIRVARQYQHPVWSDTFLSITGGELSVSLAIPLQENMLVGEVGIESLSELLATIKEQSGLEVMILDRKGQIVAHPDVTRAVQQLNLGNLPPIRNAINHDRTVTQHILLDGSERLATAAPIRGIDWVLLASQPEATVYRPIHLAGWVSLAGIGISMLISVMIGVQVASRLAARIRTYTEHAGNIARGQRPQRWPASRVEEFDDLATSLQRMSDELTLQEERLRGSENSYRELVEDIDDLVTRVSAQGRFLYVNHSSQNVFGLEPKQCLGLSAFAFIHPEDRKTTELAFRDWLQQGNSNFIHENRQISRNGQVRHIAWNIRAHRDAQGNPIDLIAIGRDITQQVQNKQALMDRERRYRALIEQCPIAVIEWNLDFRVVEWNRAAERIFGYRRDEVLGRPASILAPVEPSDAQAESWQALLNRTAGTRDEWLNLTKRGMPLTCLWHSRPLIDQNLAVTGAISLVEDITQRKAFEQKLQASEAKFSTLFHASPVPMTVSSATRGGALIDCNGAWEQKFKLNREQAIGQDEGVLGLWLNDDAREQVWRALSEEGTLAGLETSLNCGGEARLFEVSGRRISVGHDIWFVLTAVDLTDQVRQKEEIERLNATLEQRVQERTQTLEETLSRLRHTQSELIQAEKLAALGGMVAGIAHELNTPIGNSLMAATTLAEETHGVVDQFNRQQLKRSTLDVYTQDALTSVDILVRNLGKASELISSFKQVAVDQTSQQRRRFRLQEVVNEIITTLRPQLRRTPYRVDTELDVDAILDSYPGPLGQTLANLINNALIHGFEGRDEGRVTIAACLQDPDTLELTVRDDGWGIPAAHRDKLFDPFFTTRLGRGGTGLGLHIVHNLVTQVLGGQIVLLSEPGEGSCFRLLLPLSAPAAAPGDREGPDGASLSYDSSIQ